jgi:hypothetical protein
VLGVKENSEQEAVADSNGGGQRRRAMKTNQNAVIPGASKNFSCFCFLARKIED